MNDYSKITALYSRLSVGDEDRDGGESNSIQNQKKFLESYARQLKLTNIRHYIDDDESGRFFDHADFENVQRILENAPVKRPNGDGEIHPLSGLLFCKDCGAKMHIRIDYRNGRDMPYSISGYTSTISANLRTN